MSFTVSVSETVSRQAGQLRNYNRRKLPAAVQRALNRTLRGMRTDAKRVMHKKIGMSQAAINKRITTIPASKKTGTSTKATFKIRPERRVPNLGSFNPKKSRRGVRARVWERRREYKRSFIWQRETKSGDSAVTVLRRDVNAPKRVPKKGRYAGTGVKREPLIPTFGTSLHRAFVQKPRRGKQPKKIIIRLARARFNKELAAQLRRIQP